MAAAGIAVAVAVVLITNKFVPRFSKVCHTLTAGDQINSLVLVSLSLRGTMRGGKRLGVIVLGKNEIMISTWIPV